MNTDTKEEAKEKIVTYQGKLFDSKIEIVDSDKKHDSETGKSVSSSVPERESAAEGGSEVNRESVAEGSGAAATTTVEGGEPSDNTTTIIDAPVTSITIDDVDVINAFLHIGENIEVIEGKEHNLLRTLKSSSYLRWFVISCVMIVLGSIATVCFLFYLSLDDEDTKTNNSIKDQKREFAVEISSSEALKNPVSPQSKALNWMINEDKVLIPSNQKNRFVQRYISVLLYFSTDGPSWWPPITYLNATQHECEWDEWNYLPDEKKKDESQRKYKRGLHCDQDDALTNIHMYHSNMSGIIPEEIASLDTLTTVNFGGNKIMGGTIPTSLGNLKRLSQLWLFGMNLTGTIPTQLQSLPSLEVVSIYHNRHLVDDMESKVCKLPRLTYFQSDCGNGTSFPICSCCHQCCNPDLNLCCQPVDNCYSTVPSDVGYPV